MFGDTLPVMVNNGFVHHCQVSALCVFQVGIMLGPSVGSPKFESHFLMPC